MMLGHTIAGLAFFAITTLLPLGAWRTFRRQPAWRSWARPSLAVGVILVVLFFIGPALGEDRVGAWQRLDLLLALSWQAAVALHLHRQLQHFAARSPVSEVALPVGPIRKGKAAGLTDRGARTRRPAAHLTAGMSF